MRSPQQIVHSRWDQSQMKCSIALCSHSTCFGELVDQEGKVVMVIMWQAFTIFTMLMVDDT